MYDDGSEVPDYPEVRAALSRLLTPPIAKLLRNSRPWVLLKSLNTNSETPTKIWNTGMREELLSFLKKVNSVRRERLEREDAEADGATEEEQRELAMEWGNSRELEASEDFRFTCLVNELFLEAFMSESSIAQGATSQKSTSRRISVDSCSYISAHTLRSYLLH